MYLRWPTFESRDCEEGQHRFSDIIEMKSPLKPLSLFHDRSIDVTVFKFQVRAPGKERSLYFENVLYSEIFHSSVNVLKTSLIIQSLYLIYS